MKTFNYRVIKGNQSYNGLSVDTHTREVADKVAQLLAEDKANTWKDARGKLVIEFVDVKNWS